MANTLFIDLELNKEDGKTTDIIEIGWCIGDTYGNLHKKDSVFVKPSKPIDPFITSLTGIKDEHVSNAYTLDIAIEAMLFDFKKYQCCRNVAQWGEGDLRCIRQQLPTNFKLPFGVRVTDVKTVYQAWADAHEKTKKGGLLKSMEALGLTFQGEQHRASNDAYNTFLVYNALLKEFRK